MKSFINQFRERSRHHKKLVNFLYPELKKIENSNILEFGVSAKGMSTELFLEYSSDHNCKLFSVDLVDFSKKFHSSNWKFLQSRDDDFTSVINNIPNSFKLILLDTIHEAKHVKNVLYRYYDLLEVDHCFFIDDISWIPYLKNSEKNNFYAEINNLETFQILLEIYISNRENFDLEFNFEGTGICKMRKKNNNKLNEPGINNTRDTSIKNLIRKIIKR